MVDKAEDGLAELRHSAPPFNQEHKRMMMRLRHVWVKAVMFHGRVGLDDRRLTF